jgi:putative tryptophan/tyrosine transport system substrate-binding protein
MTTRRREFISLLGRAAVAWPLAARAQQPAMPVVGFVDGGSLDASVSRAAAFRKGLNETGYVEGQNATVEYHWFEGRYDSVPEPMADLVRRQVAVIATPLGASALAAKAATATIPIVFAAGEDPVKLGLVASLARPGGNATGINIFVQEVVAKRLRLLHDLVPKAIRIAVLVNPANRLTAESTIRDVQEAAPTIGLQIEILNASTIGEIDGAFATLARERPDALFVAPDTFFTSRRVQFATLTARDRIPAAYAVRELVAAGGLMSYGTDVADMFHQVGVYTGHILKGARSGSRLHRWQAPISRHPRPRRPTQRPNRGHASLPFFVICRVAGGDRLTLVSARWDRPASCAGACRLRQRSHWRWRERSAMSRSRPCRPAAARF